jgi:hypothetical protein
MSSRYRRPESVKLEISQGDWLLVKRHLTQSDVHQIWERSSKRKLAGEKTELDIDGLATSQLVAYLLDWSLVDPDDKPVVIRDQPPEVVHRALVALPTLDFTEIRDAVQAHAAAMEQEELAEKNGRGDATTSSAISASPA